MSDWDEQRARLIRPAKRIVIKVGTGVLSDGAGHLDEKLVDSLSAQIAALNDDGRRAVLVSSGAIGSGMSALALKQRPRTLPGLQAAASVGQSKLMGLYDRSLAPYGYHAAQILLTKADFESRIRYLNACNTINALFDLGAVPIINENDAVSVDEINEKFGDNDILSAFVTNMIRADLLILLTMADGLYMNPRARKKKVVSVVEKIDETVLSLADRFKTPRGVGGMRSKLEAVQVVTNAGGVAVIANGRADNIIATLLEGQPLGTIFLPSGKALRSLKRWIRFTARAVGTVIVDDGASEVLKSRTASLLPVGVIGVKGKFRRGDLVNIENQTGERIARGLSNYTADELGLIKGLRSNQIAAKLGYKNYDVVVHYDNMVVCR